MQFAPRRLWHIGHPSTQNVTTYSAKLGIYIQQAEKIRRSRGLEVIVWEKQKQLLKDKHPNTLSTMGNLSMTYQQLGNLQREEELHTIVLREQNYFWVMIIRTPSVSWENWQQPTL
ncbi:hypothetical protein DFH08DRAFT_820349 [Mycena albidolilacea]|uniref:Uncharacterized protein n=1 Tax=Mycena albidolilacea TaxID=1033008 RepID=A0AAD7EER8_9AGAR|nr:hypothetical protein DFH08DRAFT_820349 [Mycena albidolilacea]